VTILLQRDQMLTAPVPPAAAEVTTPTLGPPLDIRSRTVLLLRPGPPQTLQAGARVLAGKVGRNGSLIPTALLAGDVLRVEFAQHYYDVR
jgi:hypothetical protein